LSKTTSAAPRERVPELLGVAREVRAGERDRVEEPGERARS
jgi:hypothetical protein